ncbi:MAG: hypothetical protein H7Y03_09105 [Chitinophagaceae bacterium]|nr:hypothetical protein [Chitinophagaceae bacterium]
MRKYNNSAGDSGISGYETGLEYIQVRFGYGRSYTYSYKRAGKEHVDNMKVLAEKGRGLNTYINRYVKDLND